MQAPVGSPKDTTRSQPPRNPQTIQTFPEQNDLQALLSQSVTRTFSDSLISIIIHMDEQKERRRSGPVTYGDVFDVMGELASKAITPRDAALLQSVENMVIGMAQNDGPAAIMRSAAEENVKHGFVRDEDVTELVQKEGVTLLEVEAGGQHFVTEVVAGQVLGKCSGPLTNTDNPITIGDVLEAATLSTGEATIKKSDTVAIEAAEMYATWKGEVVLGGLAEEAYSAAHRNLHAERDEDKIMLRDVLADARKKIPDKPVHREVAELVIVADGEA